MRLAQGVRKHAVLASILTLASTAAFAQAWTPPAGATSVWLTAQTMHADAHTLGTGRLVHNIDLHAHSLTASVDYGITDRLAMSVSLPYVTSRYRGPVPHVGSIVDDGNYHGAISDLDLELRFKAIDRAFVLTPYVAGLWPTHNYSTLGHATAGRGLTEYAVGVESGHEAAWLAPGIFLGAGYGYTFVEKVHDDISVNRSNADLRLTYYLSPRWSVSAASHWQRTHGGLDLPLSPTDTHDHSQHHDQMLRADYWRASAGLGYAIRPNIELFAGWAVGIRSENAHATRAITLGVGWSFDGPRVWRRQTGPAQVAGFQR